MPDIITCRICGKTRLRNQFDGKAGGVGIILDSKIPEHKEIGEKFRVDFDTYDGILSSGYCKSCLRKEREIAIRKGKVYCSRMGHGHHYFWSKQFAECLENGNLIFNERELYEIKKEWRLE